ncbi:glycosyltransferase [Succiniclasticum ruminis]|uniref:Glycosyltransferase involved in cell wall bisynthesis n=1 Tax=Succiniclasticum ruminis DSM 9236 TaxID=1123323 RepID=A0A1I2AD87_9FIRM|nr:glycosyltransferase [Succiniclasticum ruminis]SFE40933.1 Glycosyltransferase involved in cell wall bisynthesis [Succiniclasticum ruminis DSM 9236]
MISRPKVSVIVPVYNEERFLQECMDSVLTQTLKEIEVYCVDDGSTDKSLDILKQYAKKDSRVIVEVQGNLGVSTARNKALLHCNGEFVCFMDGDDLYPDKNILEVLYKKAIEHNAKICGGSMEGFDGRRKWTFSGYLKDFTIPEEGIIRFQDYQFDYGYQRFIFERKLLIENDILFPDYKRFQDPPFFLKAMLKAESFYGVKEVTYNIRSGHQLPPGAWPAEKINDMLRGWLDNLSMSKELHMAKLHNVVISHIDEAHMQEAIQTCLAQDNRDTFILLLKINEAIDTELLDENKDKKDYIITQLRDLYNRYCRNINECCAKVEENRKLQEGNKKLSVENNDLNEKNQNLNHEAEQLRNENAMYRQNLILLDEQKQRLEDELWHVYHSVSFRTGRIFTYIPRKIRDFLWKNKNR